jgi:hypothetical protein
MKIQNKNMAVKTHNKARLALRWDVKTAARFRRPNLRRYWAYLGIVRNWK